MIKTQVETRCEMLGKYIVDNEATVRNAANHFGISKSTVHKDVTFYLRHADPILYAEVKEILEHHKETRHLRGGEATRQKYLEMKKGK